MSQFLLQMSGVPGSGKSTIARAVGAHFSAVVFDHDDTKSALLAQGMDGPASGRASYAVIRALAQALLAQRLSVIIDSPCLYDELLEFGQRIALVHGVEYRYIECVLADADVVGQRLRERVAKPSQIRSLDGEIEHSGLRYNARDLFEIWRVSMKRPASGHLIVDTSTPHDECIARSIEYVAFGHV